MKTTNTPETDAEYESLLSYTWEVTAENMVEFARKKERERDEARKIAADLRDLVPWIESEPWIFSWENA